MDVTMLEQLMDNQFEELRNEISDLVSRLQILEDRKELEDEERRLDEARKDDEVDY